MTMLEKYNKLNLDGSQIGLEKGSSVGGYFCTPKGSRIIGWDNCIHYCFIRGYGEMVFAINPESCADRYIYPLAKNFKDFLRLILACSHTSPVEQIVLWTEQQFTEFLESADNTVLPRQQAVLDNMKHSLGLDPMESPYQYVKHLQEQFDDCKIKFIDEYYDVLGLENPNKRKHRQLETLYEQTVQITVTRTKED